MKVILALPIFALLALLPAGCGGSRLVTVAVGGQEPSDPASGRSLFMRSGCFQCHGMGGEGDGAMAASLRNPPRDFRKVDAFKGGTQVRQIAFTIKYASQWSRVTNQSLEGMPDFSQLPDGELMALASYVKYLQTNQAR
ncbi:MAG: c-type cytochrome [Spirochaetes bacterium]|nr:c-type cytochrome [Spirochaetota bacterium]